MGTINGTITGVTLVSGSPAANGGLLKSFLITVDIPIYTGSTDTLTVTGVCTAIAAAERNGKVLTLIGGMTVAPGADTAAQLVYPTGASVWAMTIANPTTTGDFTGNLSDVTTTELTSSTASIGTCMIAVVKEA